MIWIWWAGVRKKDRIIVTEEPSKEKKNIFPFLLCATRTHNTKKRESSRTSLPSMIIKALQLLYRKRITNEYYYEIWDSENIANTPYHIYRPLSHTHKWMKTKFLFSILLFGKHCIQWKYSFQYTIHVFSEVT